MITIDDFATTTRRVEEIRRKMDRAAGAVESDRKILKDKYECDTLEEGRKLLDKKQKKENRLATEYIEKKAEFEILLGQADG